MARNRVRFTTGRLMAIVAVAAVAFAFVRCANELWYSTLAYGRNTSVFAIGTRVVSLDDIRDGDRVIPAGTSYHVTSDPPDDDSAYPYRIVGVRVEAGPWTGTNLGVKRTRLRAE